MSCLISFKHNYWHHLDDHFITTEKYLAHFCIIKNGQLSGWPSSFALHSNTSHLDLFCRAASPLSTLVQAIFDLASCCWMVGYCNFCNLKICSWWWNLWKAPLCFASKCITSHVDSFCRAACPLSTLVQAIFDLASPCWMVASIFFKIGHIYGQGAFF